MSNVAKLKKRALEYEQKKQFDKALETYEQVLAELDEHVDEADVALYNRVGDLLLRKGDVSEAVDHYEKAVDLYTDGGFFNNAIALCNKILRNAPGRNSVYYKLGKISARKGFINDAKQNFLEYADRMQRAGELEKAFSALKEFADLCPDQDDIRLMLADQLVKRDRKSEAIEQLQALYDKFTAEGRTKEARATVDRMKAIDAGIEPVAPTITGRVQRPNDLVFLEVDYDGTRGTKKNAVQPPAPEPEPLIQPEPPIVDEPPRAIAEIDLPSIEVGPDHMPAEDEAVAGLSRGASLAEEKPDLMSDVVSHLDGDFITSFTETIPVEPVDAPAIPRLSGLIEDTHVDLPTTGEAVSDVDLPTLDVPEDEEPTIPKPVPNIDPNALARATSGLTLIMPDFDAVDEPPVAPPKPAEKKRAESSPEPKSRTSKETPAQPAKAAPVAPAAKAGAKSEARAEPKVEPKPEPKVEAKAQPTVKPEPEPKVEPKPEPRASKGARRTPPAAALADLRGLEEEGMSVIDEALSPAIENVVDELRERVLHEPDNWTLRRELGEALLENGERSAGLKSLEEAMGGLERDGDFGAASSISEELLRVEPNSVRYHQKRVEYAVRSNDRPRLVDAYLALAECLFRSGQLDKSRAVYGRVLELAPDDARAQNAMREAFGTRAMEKAITPSLDIPARITPPTTNGAIAEPTPAERRRSITPPPPPVVEPPRRSGSTRRESFVNLSEWLREDEAEKNTRIVAPGNDAPTEQVGFAEMLSAFKQGVSQNVDDTDHESHYDLGVAYKEMGLLDEAISEFQKALRGTEQRVRTYEALGQCFVEKRQFQIALTILARALTDKAAADDTLVGVLYLLGYASESLGQMEEAMKFYERVFAVDIQFRDISDRLAAVERKAR